MPEIFALLAGVNDYTPNVGQLYGCLNDVDAYHQYLTDNFKSRSHVQTLKDGEATRQGIIDGFRNHLSQAGPDDIVIFQFSGHGARWKAAAEFNAFYPDGYDEGLVCWDSRRDPDCEDSFDLADKELGVLVSEVAADGQHVVVILDCCHSGSGTRSACDFQGMKSRVTHQVDKARSIDSYLGGFYASQLSAGNQLWTPTSRHILLAACERRKQAFEAKDRRGIFSTTLLNTLNEFGSKISYSDLFLRTRAKVRRTAMNQTPQFEAYLGFNGNSGFLGNDISAGKGTKRFFVNFELEHSAWTVECGALQGLMAKPDQLPELTLFAEGESSPVGTAKPSEIGLSKSHIELDFESGKVKTYFAEVSSLPAAPMTFGVSGDADAIKELLAAHQSDDCWSGIQLIEDDDSRFDYTVVAGTTPEDGPCFLIQESNTGERVRGFRSHSKKAAESTLKVLDQIAFWQRMLRLQNDQDPKSANRVPFEFVQVADGKDVRIDSPTVRFELADDGSEIIHGKLVTQNQTGQMLYSMVLYFSDRFGLRVLDNDEFPSSEKERTLLLNGDPVLEMYLEKEDPQKSIERFMLVVSSQPIDDFLIEPTYQPDRSSEDPHQILDDIEWGLISEPMQGRKIRTGKQKVKKIKWFTKTLQIELVKRSGKITKTDASRINDKISVASHPQLEGNIAIGNIQPTGRSVDSPDQFCHALESAGISLCNFSSARDQSASVIEFSNLQNTESLAEQPLQIDLDIPLEPNEVLLPVVHDGNTIHVVGEANTSQQGTTQVMIHELPRTTNQRSLLGAVKLYFFKAYFDQNLSGLSAAEFDGANVNLWGDDLAVRVGKAKQILLLLPGSFTSASQMLEFVKETVSQHRDECECPDDLLVLAFDYDKIGTPLEESAAILQKQLLGVGANASGKTLRVLAHGTGALVARWLIEKEGGHDYVDKLIMMGGPQLGSPLGNVKLAKTALRLVTAAAMNFFPAAAAMVGMALSAVVKADKLTVTLEQLAPQSEFLQKLNSESSDPQVPYVLVAGDSNATSLGAGWTSKILGYLQNSSVAKLLFQGSPNDMFVTVSSAQYLPGDRTPEPETCSMPCHHFGYFQQDEDRQNTALRLFD